MQSLEITNLNVNIDGQPILKDFSLTIPKGEIHALMGPNGTGKSTLLGLLAGVFYPNAGKVYAGSEKLGFVGPNPLIFTMSLRDNLMYGNKNHRSDKEIIDMVNKFKLFEDSIQIDLDIKVDNKSLSSGQMQKIAFIRVLLSDAEVLFLDESTSNLDEETKAMIFNLLLDSTLTIVNSTHDIDSFKKYTHHYKIELYRGKRLLKKVV